MTSTIDEDDADVVVDGVGVVADEMVEAEEDEEDVSLARRFNADDVDGGNGGATTK
jgi:hypothetical protein